MHKEHKTMEDIQTSNSALLLQFLSINKGLFPHWREDEKRRNAVRKLEKFAEQWAKTVAFQHRLRPGYVMITCASIRLFGSYGLGVHSSNSDIDALLIGPRFATSNDFFGVLFDILTHTPEVSDILCIKNAIIPQIKFKLDGFNFDLPYARLNAPSIDKEVDVLNPLLLTDIDHISWASMSGVVANTKILQLIPDIKVYQSLLRCVKFWAKRRGVYGNALGYLGGIHLAVLAALICRWKPNAPLSVLVSVFFQTYASWPWPKPVMLENDIPRNSIVPDPESVMPIQLLCIPNRYCDSNITKSTLDKIKREFQRGVNFTKDIHLDNFDWEPLFEQVSYANNYETFLKISVSSRRENELGNWVGWVKSRLRQLLVKLDELPGFCNPDSRAYVDSGLKEPNKVFYWGLDTKKSNKIDVKSIENYFMDIILKGRLKGNMNLCVVKASKFPKDS